MTFTAGHLVNRWAGVSPEERFLAKVEPEPMSGCWLWMGYRHYKGYGEFRFDGRQEKAHRVAWLLFRGPIPGDLHVLHVCDTPPCVRPDHLYLGTELDNARDREARGRGHDRSLPRPWAVGLLCGIRNGRARLTPETAEEIRRRRAMGETINALARAFGVSHGTAWNAVHGVHWPAVALPLQD